MNILMELHKIAITDIYIRKDKEHTRENKVGHEDSNYSFVGSSNQIFKTDKTEPQANQHYF